jgi:A/G-specific adenine glycosylase
VAKPKPVLPHYLVTAAVIERGGQVLISQRPLTGLLGGLWEFPGGKTQPGEDLKTCLRREICEELGVQIEVGEGLGVYRHAYTHFRLTLHAFHCQLLNSHQPQAVGVNDLRWVLPGELASFPMGKLDRQIARKLSP